MPSPSSLPIKAFASQALFEKWLKTHHTDETGFRLRIFKKGSGKKTITYDEALDTALCYGWIDGLKQAHDDVSWLQMFTPRRAKSPWSKRNTEHVERLIKAKKMQPAGLAAVEAAKKDGRWKAAYASGKNSVVPKDLLAELRKFPKAKAFFESLNKANIYAITYRLETAKMPETRARRMATILEMLKKGQTFH